MGYATLMDAQRRFDQAANLYLPDPLRLLFIAEAPPAFKVNRLFYFTGLTDGDTLFLEMMKVLYPAEIGYTNDTFQPGLFGEADPQSETGAAAKVPKRWLSSHRRV